MFISIYIIKKYFLDPLEIYINGEKFFYGIGTEKSYTKAFEKYTVILYFSHYKNNEMKMKY